MATNNYDEKAAENALAMATGGSIAGKIVADPSAITKSYYATPMQRGAWQNINRPVYEPSDATKQAGLDVTNQEAAKPGEYKSSYGDQIQGLIDGLLNRKKFNYDFSADPMYQQYADRYQQQGQQAMKGAMGDAAGLTGGYGNTYAQMVGQQTYQQYLQQLNDVVPTLRDAAYQAYKDEGAGMRDNLGMLQTQDAVDYNRYRDNVGDWKNELDYYYSKYNDMTDREYERYKNDVAAWEADRLYWEARDPINVPSAGGGSGGDDGGKKSSGKKATTIKAVAPLTAGSAIGPSTASGRQAIQDLLNSSKNSYRNKAK